MQFGPRSGVGPSPLSLPTITATALLGQRVLGITSDAAAGTIYLYTGAGGWKKNKKLS